MSAEATATSAAPVVESGPAYDLSSKTPPHIGSDDNPGLYFSGRVWGLDAVLRKRAAASNSRLSRLYLLAY